LIGKQLHLRLATSLIISINLFLLAGCQGMAAGANGLGNVGLGSGNVAFGNVTVGSSKSVPDSISNRTSIPVTISSIAGLTSDFQVTGLTLPLVLAGGQSIPFNVQFQPTVAGSPDIEISFLGQNGHAYASLSAAGIAVSIGQLSPNPSPLAFGNTRVGANQTNTVALTNNGGTDLTITQATLSGAGFTMGNLTLPLTLHAGATSLATITFAPTGSGAFNGTASFATTSGEKANKISISFTGFGVPPGALTATPTSMAFGTVQIGSNSSQSSTLTNTGSTAITISQATATGTGFSFSGLALPVTLSGGQSVSFTVLFSPTASGATSGGINIVSNASDHNLTIPLSGTGQAPVGTLTANPTALAFGTVQVGNTTNLTEALTNNGASAITISQANLTGAAFSISGLNLPLNLNANQSVTFTATFSPTTSGAAAGNLNVVSNASNSSLNIAFSGTGGAPGSLAVSPASLSFGNVTIGSSASLTGSLTASGSSITITSASLTNNEFAVSGISLPVTLAAGQSASFSVTFTPQSAGAASASLAFASNAGNSPAVETMTGTGTAATPHTVALSWNASNDAVGYNIYRGANSGGPYSMINSSPDGSTTYTDSTVSSGDTYYYVATAVDANANESGYSNETQAVIPNP
jgi:hypothetical protein